MTENTIVDGTKMQKRAKELQKFRYDFATLRNKYTLNELAKIIGIDASNLSSYGSGMKNPGQRTIEMFYAKMRTEIGYSDQIDYSNVVEEPVTEPSGRSHHEPAALSKDNLDALIDRFMSAHEKMLESLQLMTASNEKLVSSTEKLVINNTRLVNELLPSRKTQNRNVGRNVAKKKTKKSSSKRNKK
jgi:hypothetical protein